MTVPKRRELRRPILEIVSGAGCTVSPQQIRDSLIKRLALTEDDLQEKIPSGSSRFVNNANRAISSLKDAGLLHRPSSGLYQITPQAREFLSKHEGDIFTRHLNRQREMKQQRFDVERETAPPITAANELLGKVDNVGTDSTDATPNERMAELYQELDDDLTDELLESVKKVSPARFERLVLDLLKKMGYGESIPTGGSGDGGIDGIINQDSLGLEKVYIQAKRWQNQVGEPPIRNFSGSLDARGANKGVFITTSTFSSTAQRTAQNISAGNKFIRLIDGPELARLMIDHGVGVVTEINYEVKKLDENYFAEI